MKKSQIANRKSLTSAVLITTLILSAGCSESGSEPAGENTIEQELYKDIELREGVSVVHADNTGTGLLCVNGDLDLTAPTVRSSLNAVHQQDELQNNSVWHRAFWVHTEDDVNTVIRQNTEASNGSGPMDFDEFDKVVKRHYGEMFRYSDEPVVTMLVVIPTADHFVEPNNRGPCVTLPPTTLDPQPADLEEWVSSCGVHYLEEVKYGHYFLMSATLANLANAFQAEPEQGWAMLTQRLQLEAARNQTDTPTSLDAIAQQYPNIEFFVTASHEYTGGVSYPSWYNYPFLNIGHFGAFVEHYQKAGDEGVLNQDFSKLGVPIWQYTPVYHPKNYMEEICGLRINDIDVAFSCYYEFEEAERSYAQRLLPQLDVYLDALQNPSKYQQPNDSGDWQDFITNTLTPLQQSLPTLRANCEGSLASGNANNICAACDPTPIRDVIETFGSLTRPQRAIPPTNPNFQMGGIYHYLMTNNEALNLGPIEDKFCSYTWVGGKLEGLGEGTRLTRSGSDWKAETFSQQTANSTRLRAEVTCTDSIVRSANCGGSYCKWSETCVSGTCQTSQEYMDTTATFYHTVNNQDAFIQMWPPLGYPSSPYLATFAGISGKTRGLAEEVVVQYLTSPNPPRLRVRSQQGTMRGWANGFKITDSNFHTLFEVNPGAPQGSDSFEVVLNNQTAFVEEPVEFTLAPENQAFCYLTSVGGEFEGAGENVKILRKSGSWVLHVLAAGPAPCAPGSWAAVGCLPDTQQPLRARARCVEYIQ